MKGAGYTRFLFAIFHGHKPILMLATAEHPAPESFRRDARVISVVGFAHGTSHFFHLALAPLFPWLKAAFVLSYAELGLLVSVFFVVSGIGQALAGFVVDRRGAYPVLLTGVSLLAISALVLASADHYATLICGAAIGGLGNSVFHPADFTLLNRHVSAPRLAHAFSAHGIAGTLGWATAPVFLAGIASVAGWRAALIGASMVAIAALCTLVLNRDRLNDASGRGRAAGAPGAPAQTLQFLRVPAVWMCFSFFLISAMFLGAVQNFAPAALVEMYDIPFALATSFITFYMLANTGGQVVGGFLAARTVHHERVIAAAFIAAAVMSLWMASGEVPRFGLMLPIAVMGFAAGIAGPSRDLMVRAAAPRNATGRVYGVVYSGLDTGLAVAPLLFGAVMDAHRPAWLFAGVAALQLLALGTAIGVGARAQDQRRAAA